MSPERVKGPEERDGGKNGGGPPAKSEEPPGRCEGCGEVVPPNEILPLSTGEKRHFSRNKNACGPVMTMWEYHVAFWFSFGGEQAFKDGVITTRVPIEAGQHIGIVKQIIASTFKVRDNASGGMLIGQAEPEIALLRWTLLRSW